MIDIIIQDELCGVVNKDIVIKRFAKACSELGFNVNKYILTEYFEDNKPTGYKIHFS